MVDSGGEGTLARKCHPHTQKDTHTRKYTPTRTDTHISSTHKRARTNVVALVCTHAVVWLAATMRVIHLKLVLPPCVRPVPPLVPATVVHTYIPTYIWSRALVNFTFEPA
eukprot:GHVU01182322.1.p2 GENE.GHVU01182322.1~~GHVU01182322.1.p2  ORF type:complete len:110 (-),score=1.69 GHVU01182322.1:566-895(-)